MTMSDPIADLLTRIGNGLGARHPQVRIPSSGLKREVVRILKEENYILDFRLEEDNLSGLIVLHIFRALPGQDKNRFASFSLIDQDTRCFLPDGKIFRYGLQIASIRRRCAVPAAVPCPQPGRTQLKIG